MLGLVVRIAKHTLVLMRLLLKYHAQLLLHLKRLLLSGRLVLAHKFFEFLEFKVLLEVRLEFFLLG